MLLCDSGCRFMKRVQLGGLLACMYGLSRVLSVSLLWALAWTMMVHGFCVSPQTIYLGRQRIPISPRWAKGWRGMVLGLFVRAPTDYIKGIWYMI